MCSNRLLLPIAAPDNVPAGTAGGEAQQADIRQLLKELELKKAKLNELKGDSRKTESAIAKIRDDDTDAQRLTPDDCVEENAYIQVRHSLEFD
jgi:ATP-dependent protease ClpP protease subunit